MTIKIKRPGALHAKLHVPQAKNIPVAKIIAASHKTGLFGEEARFALNARKFHHGGKK